MIEQKNEWFIPIKTSKKAKNQLFAFHYAAASASIFYSWKEYLNEDTTLYAVELPGRATRLREEPTSDINNITKSIAKAMRPYLEEVPTFLFGHSMGGILAYETAFLLDSDARKTIHHLIVSAVNPPECRKIINPIHSLDDDVLKKEVSKYGGIPDHLLENTDFWDIFLPVVRADFKMIANYKPNEKKPPLDCMITAIVGKNDKIVGTEKAKSWKKFTNKDFNLIETDGDHFFIKETKNILEIINVILK